MLTQNTGIPTSTYHKIHRNTFYFFICETIQMYHISQNKIPNPLFLPNDSILKSLTYPHNSQQYLSNEEI